jgi:ferric-dicitrate binding protein FerR (iron transport regulator)
MDLERARQLLMAKLDGELDSEEAAELEAALAGDPSLRREFQRWELLGAELGHYRIKDPADEVLEALSRSVIARTGLHLGWFFAGGGALLLFAGAVIAVLRDPVLPLLFRASAGGLLLGLTLLFSVKVRERWLERQHDPYRHIVR